MAAGMIGALSLAGPASAADLGDTGGGGYKDAPAPSYFSDDSIGWRYSTKFKEPGTNNGNDIEKNILQYNHFNTDAYGANLLNVDALFSGNTDPTTSGDGGATEVYAVYRRYWSISKITGWNVSNSIIRDIDLTTGGDFNTKNTFFAPEKKLLVVGPQIEFNVPVGFFNLGFNFTHEWNHNGLAPTDVSFDPAFEIEAGWSFPFTIGRSSLAFQGFFNFVAPKGNQPCAGIGTCPVLGGPASFAPNATKFEILTRPEIMLDVGNYFGKPNKFQVGFGYEYWLNKFGNNHDEVPGSLANTPELIARIHF
jgi:hypothetical protein